MKDDFAKGQAESAGAADSAGSGGDSADSAGSEGLAESADSAGSEGFAWSEDLAGSAVSDGASSAFAGEGAVPASPVRMKLPTPWVTNTLCVLMIATWCLEMLDLIGIIPWGVIQNFAFVPILGMFEPWRFLTGAFLHSYPTPFHLAFNVWALWVVGRQLEPLLGRLRMLLAFVIFAVGGLLAQCLTVFFNHNSWVTPVVGASGAVFGFFGMVLAIQKSMRIPAAQMATLIGVNFVFGFVFPGIAWVAHLGGLLLGLVLGFWTGHRLRLHDRAPAQGQPRPSPWPDLAVYGGLMLALLALNWLFYHSTYTTIYSILGFTL